MISPIVLEGPDGGGKTTLARRLENMFDYRYVKNDKPREGEDVFATYTAQLVRAMRSKRPTVIDRLHLAEIVYGKVMRGQSRLDAYAVKLLNRLIAARGGRTILCMPPYACCEIAWHLRKKSEYVQEAVDLGKIYAEYAVAFGRDQGTYDVYDYNFPKPWRWFQRFVPRCPRGVVGSPVARFLIVGKRGNPRENAYDLAFHDRGGCSRFLNEALWDAGYEEKELAFVNALDAKGRQRDIGRLVDDFEFTPPVVIALGRKARAVTRTTLRVGKGPFYELPHPQYWKRFHKRSRSAYVDWLESIKESNT